jgi:hypothetical protein
MGNLNFNAENVDPKKHNDLLPEGLYLINFLPPKEGESAIKAAQNGSGEYLSLCAQIIQGEHEGRLLFVNLCLWHNKANVVAIAERELSAICHAVGVMKVADSSQLVGLPMGAFVKIKQGKDGRDPQNVIDSYCSKDEYLERINAPKSTNAPAWG